jgi:hypothetical protein
MDLKRLARLSKQDPFYYRWVLKPSDGSVDLSHNFEDHPAHVRYHGELATQHKEPDLIHGYAYRLDNGWRLTDWEHKPLDDKFVVAQVVRAIRQREGHQPAPKPQGYSEFEEFHYGIPR